jgi:ribose transport system substrate-binding protein
MFINGRLSVRKRWATLSSLALVALVTAACGSTGGASPTASKSTDVTGAKALVDQAMAAKTQWIGPTSAPKPVTGKTIGVIPCASFVEGCAREAAGVVEAAKAIGWNSILLDGKVSADVELQAMSSLISRHVDAIVLNSINATSVGDGMAKAKAAGIPVITSFAQDPQQLGGIENVRIDDPAAGEAVAAYIVANGGGKVIVFEDNSAEEVINRTTGLLKGFAKFGGAQMISRQGLVGNLIGPAEEPLMSSLLQGHPAGTVNWIYCGYDFMCSPLVRAIQRAGRTEIKATGYDGNVENLNFIRNGQVQSATMGYPLEWAGWAVVDDLNRYFNHQTLWSGTKYLQYRLLTVANLPPAGQSYEGDLDFRAKFKQLWGIS